LPKEIYDEEYFERGLKTGKSGYENYRWLPNRIHKEIRSVIYILGIQPKERVLDFGCAKGYWVKGFRDYGIEAFGCDTSEYAISHCDKSVKPFLFNKLEFKEYDYIVSRNTFEHIDEYELHEILNQFAMMTTTLFFTVPLAKSDGGEYIMQSLDTTHKLKWTNEHWISFCHECGWKLKELYYNIKGIHDKWDNYPNAIGFYVFKR
jgi:cyclopropane fatty-acyl-phospholipid synthase-like methyltransferase